MLRTSFRTLFIFLIIAVAVGVSIGYFSRSGHVRSQARDIEQQQAQVSLLLEDIARLNSQMASLTIDLQSKQTEYEKLLADHNSTSDELKTSRGDYDKLLEVSCDGALVELDRIREQLEQVQSEKNTLSSDISNMKIENSMLRTSLNSASDQVNTLTQTLGKAQSQLNDLTIKVAQLEKQLTPSPDHARDPKDVFGILKSAAWEGRDYELQTRIEQIGKAYHDAHTYIPGETDCSDMAVDLWNILLTANIKSVIVVGNLDKLGEEFTESEHAWLDIFNAKGEVIYMEPTTGEVLYGKRADGSPNTRVTPYREGWYYDKPSDLRKDLKSLW